MNRTQDADGSIPFISTPSLRIFSLARAGFPSGARASSAVPTGACGVPAGPAVIRTDAGSAGDRAAAPARASRCPAGIEAGTLAAKRHQHENHRSPADPPAP